MREIGKAKISHVRSVKSGFACIHVYGTGPYTNYRKTKNQVVKGRSVG